MPDLILPGITKYLAHCRKLRVERPAYRGHHRGGWRQVIEVMVANLHAEDGVRLIAAAESTMFSGVEISEPWVGFVHEVPRHGRRFPDLERLLKLDTWKASVNRCRGLWVLSRFQKSYLQSCQLPFPIASVYYPTEIPREGFSLERFLGSQPR